MASLLPKAVATLRSGGVIAHATDTCYGFACDVLNKKALARLYRLKKMPRSKPVSLLVADVAMAKKFGVFPKSALKLAQKYWPGALTIIVKRKKTLPTFFNHGHMSVGFRVPGDKLSRELPRAFGSPLSTTSANISGQPSPYSVSAIRRQFVKQPFKPDLIMDAGRLKKNPPSTIIDMTEKTPKIIRQGSVRLLFTEKNRALQKKKRR